MKREPILMSMKNSKKELFKAGKENFFRFLELEEEFQQLKITNLSLLNSLRFVLKHMPQIAFTFEDDGVEEPDATPVEKQTGIEVQ